MKSTLLSFCDCVGIRPERRDVSTDLAAKTKLATTCESTQSQEFNGLLLSRNALGKVWDSAEEEAAWANL